MGHSVEWQKRIEERRWLASLLHAFETVEGACDRNAPCDPALTAAVIARLAQRDRAPAAHH